MKCSRCDNKSVHQNFCKEHFIEYFENKVYDTINEYNLIPEGSRIAVAASGGKDSITVLYLLSKRYDVTAIAVDEGIKDYRDKTLIDLKGFCDNLGVKLETISMKEYFGMDLDSAVKKTDKIPCAVCGVARRYALNKARGFDVMATGHNHSQSS